VFGGGGGWTWRGGRGGGVGDSVAGFSDYSGLFGVPDWEKSLFDIAVADGFAEFGVYVAGGASEVVGGLLSGEPASGPCVEGGLLFLDDFAELGGHDVGGDD
jgi:hypothetical protein